MGVDFQASLSRAAVVSRIAHAACEEAPPERLGERWWETLPADFSQRREAFSLGVLDRAQVGATAAADVVLRTAAACLVGITAVPLGYNPAKIRQALAERELYAQMAESGDASRFFRTPDERHAFDIQPTQRARFLPRDGVCEDISFVSTFEPSSDYERQRYRKHVANRTAHLRLWRHHDGPRPTILTIHGFSADLHMLNEWFFALPWLYRLGYDVGLFTLPFHGRRQTRLSPFSGHGFFAGGVTRINEAFAQAVYDFRIFVDLLRQERSVPKVGVMGVSLGGFTSALLAATEPRLDFAIANVPLASVVDLVLEWEPIATAIRGSMKLLSTSVADARQLLAVSCPLTYPTVLPRDRLFVIGGVGDRLAPPKHSRLLWEHWGRCRIHWFPGSHLIHLDRGNYLRQIARFLRHIHFHQRGEVVHR